MAARLRPRWARRSISQVRTSLFALCPSSNGQRQIDAEVLEAGRSSDIAVQLIYAILSVASTTLEPFGAYLDDDVQTAAIEWPELAKSNLYIAGPEVSVIRFLGTLHGDRYEVRQRIGKFGENLLRHDRCVGHLNEWHPLRVA